MRTVEELEALLETVTRERDLSISAWESAGMQGRTAQSAMLELARQLEEARAEVDRLTDERDDLCAWQVQIAEPLGYLVRAFGVGGYDVAEPSVIVKAWRELECERDEARAEVERLRRELERAGSRECDAPACNCGAWHHREPPRAAYRRGAEAMREAIASACISSVGDAIRALPIPEEP